VVLDVLGTFKDVLMTFGKARKADFFASVLGGQFFLI